MRRVLMLAVAGGALAGLFGLVPSAAAQGPSGPPLTTPEATLAAALHCPQPLTNVSRDPVLLVPGTGLEGQENWDWSYGLALPAAGFAYCTVDLPGGAMADIQESSEYVVHAIRTMAEESGRKVAVIGYSQGGLEVRWALRYWPDLGEMVSDSISLASPHTGADTAALFCQNPCGPSIWQMVPGSSFLRALNSGADVWGPVDYTSVYSLTDDVVIPPVGRSRLTAAPGVNLANIAVQEVCPASTVKHIETPGDGTYFAIVMDALLRPGPADASRIADTVCTEHPYVPGVTAEVAAQKASDLNAAAFGRILAYPVVAAEPALRAYAAADASAAATPVAPKPPATGNGVAGERRGGTIAMLALLAFAAVCPVASFAALRVRRRPA